MVYCNNLTHEFRHLLPRMQYCKPNEWANARERQAEEESDTIVLNTDQYELSYEV
jgi:hypothetical protein